MNDEKIDAIHKAINTVNRDGRIYAKPDMHDDKEFCLIVRKEAAAELYDILIADGFYPRVIGGAAGTLILSVYYNT